jgi:O-acetyl-ADP-ribose deacetylase (regulator of RNase III)
MIEVIDGDLLEAPEQYIMHQCNCVTSHAAGLAKKLFEKFPYADIYKERANPHVPSAGCEMGDIIVRGNGSDQRLVVNALAQYYPGKPKYPQSKRDGYAARIDALKACLRKVSAIKGIQSIAFPDHMGCTLAGGDWPTYLGILTDWADQNPGIKVVIRRYG